ncbi:hypothetical protein DBR32_10110 [Taibaiella sp. KBW10]|uniref:T9SS type A sorting domain-containing protein n=1 Tax=Taibaiella sp. KBW10 TaxID=2153357 RepID=UPI000F5B324B|nr:T9SS type A sorting domain-containing protein [Taibaiella sp. KBW10]RQO31051.1 hypothetical protein DBR32_10110 [Taibaiella sp. KBW10]
MKTNFLQKYILLLLLISLFPLYRLSAQNCGPANTIYGISSSDQRTLVRIDTATGVETTIGNVFGGGTAATDPAMGTSAIAVDPTTGIIWFSTRTPANIYSYTPGATNPYGTTTAAFGLSATMNKAAYNPADGNIYFHAGGTLNTLYRFNPATPNTAPVVVGNLGLTGITTTAASFGGGDIAFDGLGNLTGAFTSQNVLAVFPANYDANGTYLGINLAQGTVIANFTTAVASVAFLPSGDYLSGGGTGVIRVNTNTAAQTTLSAFGTADFASCAAPVPNVIVRKSATSSCTAANQITLTFTITVRNTGQFAAINTHIFDLVPAGLTITGATLNGTAIPGANNALFNTGNGPLISSSGAAAFQNGVIERGDSATIVITATAVPGTYSNQAGVSYTGVEKLNLPNDRVSSDNPATATANDPTIITGGCSSLTGTLFNDNDGMTDNTVDGTGIGVAGTTQLYINLVNGSGVVIATVPINANGTYTIPNIPDGNFTAQLSSTQGEVGQAAPAQLLPTGWVATGESFAGVNDAVAGGGLAVVISGNTINANFGIERLPESYPVSYNPTGVPTLTTLNTQPLQGSDPEDQVAQGSWSGKSIVIDTLPTNGYILRYNGIAVTAGTPIPNYNPALLTIAPGASSAGTGTTTFKYSTIDAAGKKDPTPAAYTVTWSIPLPAQLLSFTGRASKDCSFNLNWNTGVENNLKHFALQRSNDGIIFETITIVAPKGRNSAYSYTDKQAKADKQYYRLHIVDLDDLYQYSKAISLSNNCQQSLSIYPNPARDQVTINGLTSNQSDIKVYNVEGKLIMNKTVKGVTVTLDISTLPNGVYHFEIISGNQSQTIEVHKR